MKDYNATVEVATKIGGDQVDELMERLLPFQGTVGETSRGYAYALITLPAATLEAAAAAAVAIVTRAYAGAEAIACEVLTTEEFDRRVDWTDVPPLVSVSEAAEILGVSSQRIKERIHEKSLQGIKVGNSYVLVKSTLTTRRPGRPRKNARSSAGE